MHNDLFSIGPFTVHMYGLMVALGMLAALTLVLYRAKKRGMSTAAVEDIALFGVICGFVGAKLLYCLIHLGAFLQHPSMLWSSEGFLIYGGIVGALIFAMIYCRVKKLCFVDYFDLCMPSVALAQGIGRMGCFFAGCCYGKPTDSFLGITFPADSIAPGGVKLWPTQLFSVGFDLILAGILLLYAKRPSGNKTVGLLYVAILGLGRFVVDFFRDDGQNVVAGVSMSQVTSLVMVIAATAALLVIRARRKKKAAMEFMAADEPEDGAGESAK